MQILTKNLGSLCLAFALFSNLSVNAKADKLPKVGDSAPASIVAEFVSGPFEERKSACPVLLHRETPKIAIFAKNFDSRLMPLTAALSEIIEKEPSLKWSFVFVSHENAPTPSDAEWEKLMSELKEYSKDPKVRQFSFGAMQRLPDPSRNLRARRKVDIFEQSDVVVMLIVPNRGSISGVIRFIKAIHADEIESKSIEQMAQEIKAELATLSAQP